jgi:hypothetical protein
MPESVVQDILIDSVDDTSLAPIAKYLPNLVELDMSHCAGLSDSREIQQLARKCAKLKILNLSYCDRLFGTVVCVNERNGSISSLLSKRGCDLRVWSDCPPRKIDDRFSFVTRMDHDRFCLVSKLMDEFRSLSNQL